jgi:hypothetical protein
VRAEVRVKPPGDAAATEARAGEREQHRSTESNQRPDRDAARPEPPGWVDATLARRNALR